MNGEQEVDRGQELELEVDAGPKVNSVQELEVDSAWVAAWVATLFAQRCWRCWRAYAVCWGP